MTHDVTISVCSTCRPEGAPSEAERPGRRLGRAVKAETLARGVEGRVAVRAIACLSACARACTATVAASGKFAYVVGALEEADAAALVTFALLHADSSDGIPPWRARPEKVRKNTVARLPPPGAEHALVEEI
jgi:predicted metal-binding protein